VFFLGNSFGKTKNNVTLFFPQTSWNKCVNPLSEVVKLLSKNKGNLVLFNTFTVKQRNKWVFSVGLFVDAEIFAHCPLETTTTFLFCYGVKVALLWQKKKKI
jgi:hypothetical protein